LPQTVVVAHALSDQLHVLAVASSPTLPGHSLDTVKLRLTEVAAL